MKNYLFFISCLLFTSCQQEDVIPDDTDISDDLNEIQYTQADPCTTGNEDCLETIRFTSEDGRTGSFTFYQTLPILNDTAIWGNIKNAVIVLHGNNRDGNNYFNFMTNSVKQIGALDKTLIISPNFFSNVAAGPGQLFWRNGWRVGDLSANVTVNISTFTIMDSLLETIANKDRFPFLEKIILTGHSSGAIFTQSYAFARDIKSTWGFDVDYIVANSQYFYYPQDVRYNPSSETFESPTECPDFNHWPYGFEELNEYMRGSNRDELNQLFVEKKVTYLLGTSDVVTTGSLNTSDCAAVLLGEHRLNRGENMFLFMDTFYPNVHNHQKILINNVGHNGQAMYNSISYRNLMKSTFDQ